MELTRRQLLKALGAASLSVVLPSFSPFEALADKPIVTEPVIDEPHTVAAVAVSPQPRYAAPAWYVSLLDPSGKVVSTAERWDLERNIEQMSYHEYGDIFPRYLYGLPAWTLKATFPPAVMAFEVDALQVSCPDGTIFATADFRDSRFVRAGDVVHADVAVELV